MGKKLQNGLAIKGVIASKCPSHLLGTDAIFELVWGVGSDPGMKISNDRLKIFPGIYTDEFTALHNGEQNGCRERTTLRVGSVIGKSRGNAQGKIRPLCIWATFYKNHVARGHYLEHDIMPIIPSPTLSGQRLPDIELSAGFYRPNSR